MKRACWSLGLCMAFTILPRDANADPQQATSWWVEVHPWTCASWTGDLARALELACDAPGRACRVAPSVEAADHRAVLACEAGKALPVSIEARTTTGEVAWMARLTGDPHERIRTAAAWIARDARDDAPAD